MADAPSPRITKTDLIEQMMQRFPLSRKQCTEIMAWLPDTIAQHLAKGAEVHWLGLGTFRRQIRAAGSYRNPGTQEMLKKPRSRVPRFSASKPLRVAVAFPAQAKALLAKQERRADAPPIAVEAPPLEKRGRGRPRTEAPEVVALPPSEAVKPSRGRRASAQAAS